MSFFLKKNIIKSSVILRLKSVKIITNSILKEVLNILILIVMYIKTFICPVLKLKIF